MQKVAIITGISGQDGSYLAKFLINKGYKVIGVTRSLKKSKILSHVFLSIDTSIIYKECNLADFSEVKNLIQEFIPNEIYNLSAQSSVGLSFEQPLQTIDYNTKSVLNILEVIKTVNNKIKFYQASSSEMFGNIDITKLPVNEFYSFHPVSPYGISKATAHWLTINYREAYGLYACCGILFNHESSLRPSNFVIKKIINTALRIKNGELDELVIGNLSIKRDWGYAPDYVSAMWLMLQQPKPLDFLICSGKAQSLQDLIHNVFSQLDLDIYKHLRFSPKYLRALELPIIFGDNSLAKEKLNWSYDLNSEIFISTLIKDEIEWMNFERNY